MTGRRPPRRAISRVPVVPKTPSAWVAALTVGDAGAGAATVGAAVGAGNFSIAPWVSRASQQIPCGDPHSV